MTQKACIFLVIIAINYNTDYRLNKFPVNALPLVFKYSTYSSNCILFAAQLLYLMFCPTLQYFSSYCKDSILLQGFYSNTKQN